jgi:hypothetical protein
MEEPFERTNAGRAIIRRERFEDILAAFRDAEKKVHNGCSLQGTILRNRISADKF